MINLVRALGFNTKTEAVLALRAQGLATRDIARKIGIEPKSVSALEASAQRSKGRASERRWSDSPSTLKQHTVTIDNDTLIALRPHAARRSMSVNQLVRAMIDIVADDGLIDALLDDADEVGR